MQNETGFEDILRKRRAGVLLHISSLPGTNENGDFGKQAYYFVDFLHNAGVSVWQTLPLGMPHGDGSPYQCLSAHAGNPAFISFEWLEQQGWLDKEKDYEECQIVERNLKNCLLAKAFEGFHEKGGEAANNAFSKFCQRHAHWLDDFVLFMALKAEFNQKSWQQWPEEFKDREEKSLLKARFRLSKYIQIAKFEQFVFFTQWQELKAYAHQHDVALFGDIPIFVAYDSADVWAHRDVFKLDEKGEMAAVAGVPPDYFSETGQRWGNPHYNWKYLQETGFKWWVDRMKTQLDCFDIIRIDHFRGLESAWEIPAEDETAVNGKWAKAPGAELLTALKEAYGKIPLVAEDLGVITEEVEALRDEFKLPGMKILQFAFGSGADNPYLPFNYQRNSVVYTGTHDNDTTEGWFSSLSQDEQDFINVYLGHPRKPISFMLMRTAFASVANLAIIPMQDILHLGSEHRMNIPGTMTGNWQWRFSWDQLTDEKINEFKHLIGLFGRR
jgi:4-alpha-glucanotransferase